MGRKKIGRIKRVKICYLKITGRRDFLSGVKDVEYKKQVQFVVSREEEWKGGNLENCSCTLLAFTASSIATRESSQLRGPCRVSSTKYAFL